MTTGLEFLSNEANQDQGLGDAGIETFRETPYASAAKEAGQNSRDAKADTPVKLEFNLLDVSRRDLPFADQLAAAIDACLKRVEKRYDEKEDDFFKRAKGVLEKDSIKVLEISDTNTTGLVGPAEEGTPFYALLKSTGVSNKQLDTSGGSFGIGKNASFAVSDLQTVLYSTIYHDKERDRECFLAQGKTQLVSHVDQEGNPRNATGWWGLPGFKEIEDKNAVPEWMRRNDVGTSVFSIGFREEESWQFRVAAALLRTFFVAIHEGEMVFSVNREIEIDSSTAHQHFQDPRIMQAATDSHAKEDFEFARSLYNCLVSEESKEQTVKVPAYGNTRFGTASIRILKKPGLPKRIGIVRNGMMITDNLKNFDHPFRIFPMCADFVALVRPCQDRGSSLLKKLENPSHDSFSSERITDAVKRDEAFDSVKNLGKKIRNIIKTETESKPEEVESLTELAEYFADENEDTEEGEGETKPTKFRYELDRNRKQRDTSSSIQPAPADPASPTPSGPTPSGPAPSDPTPSDPKAREVPVPIFDIRYIKANGLRTLHFTPGKSCTSRIIVGASGLAYAIPLQISQSSKGTVKAGQLIIDLVKDERTSLDIDFSDQYEGPIEIFALVVGKSA